MLVICVIDEQDQYWKLSNGYQILTLLIETQWDSRHYKAAQFRKPHMYVLRTYFLVKETVISYQELKAPPFVILGHWSVCMIDELLLHIFRAL